MTQALADGVRPELLEAFDTMWGLHPSPVLLVKGDRQIMAINEAGRALGIPVGVKCFNLSGKDRVCDKCLAGRALKDHSGQRIGAWQEKLNMFMDSYWVPVKGETDLYVHFGNDITAFVRQELCR